MKKYENTNFNINNVGEVVELKGWVQKKRNLGGLIFIDLRDRSGIIQLVIRPESDIYEVASNLKSEYVIWAKGKIVERESKNEKIITGAIEVEVSELEIINTAKEIPFEISDDTTALEDTRLKYRYLDLRRPSLQHNLMVRSKVTLIARNYLSKLGFVEVETPILCKSTPEGARDYLVPSRISKGHFYALPQSPQIYKQLLMIGGMEKYFQIARCFRDEDLRADRQPEFTQIDIEMSFAEEEDIWQVTEGLMREIFKEIKGVELEKFTRLTYNECIDRFGSDKPDTRFEMEIQDITEIFQHTDFQIFKDVITKRGVIRAIVAKNTASKYSRKDIDKLTEYVKIYQAKALAFLKYKDQEWSGSIAKVLSDEEKEQLKMRLGIEEEDTIFIIADTRNIASTALGALRLKLGHEKQRRYR